MKKFFCVVFVLVLTSALNAGLIGDFYSNDRLGCSINGNGWAPGPSRQNKVIVFRSGDGVSEVGLDVKPLSMYGVRTAYGVARSRVEGYDSWQYIGGRPMEDWEINNANANDGFVAMYSKNVFSKSGGAIKILVTEKYYVKFGNVYIVSLLTSSQAWPSAKGNLLRIADSFKLFDQ